MRRQKNRKPKQAATTQSMPELQPDAAGVDIHPQSVYVGVPQNRASVTVRCFGTFTPDLIELADWLAECKIRTVAMESTGVYWIPLFELLEERGFEVLLVNAHHVKHVPGRKSDVVDSQWLQFLHAVGLLRGSYRPPKEICAFRAIIRQRAMLLRCAASHVQHMQKSLSQMNLHLHHVVTDITGVTGLAIIKAILAGQHDPAALCKLRDRRIKATEAEVKKAMSGNYMPEHLFTLGQAFVTYCHYQTLITECETEIERRLRGLAPMLPSQSEPTDTQPTDTQPTDTQSADTKPVDTQSADTKRKRRHRQDSNVNFNLTSEYERVFGIDLTRIPGINVGTVEVVLGEAGPTIPQVFRSSAAFASWGQACPQTNKSGGKDLPVKSKKGKPRLYTALRMAAVSLFRSQTSLGARFRRMVARLGTPKALAAMAHLYFRIIYHLLKTGQQYDESVYAELEKAYEDRRIKNLHKTAKQLGFRLTPLEEPAT